MRVVIDTLGAPSKSGGMRQFASALIGAWLLAAPEDELVIMGNPWIAEEFRGTGATLVVIREGVIRRVLGQWLMAGLVARSKRADVLLSMSLIVSPLVPRRRRACVVHDWRHVRHPEEFGRMQRLYRRTWLLSTRQAGLAVQISSKTDRETAEIVPGARRIVIEHGRDQAATWPDRDVTPTGDVVTFGHHTNKRPGLVIDGLALVPQGKRPGIVVLGATGAYAESLSRRAAAVGVRASFPGFVDEAAYQAYIRGAAVVVLASSDEGFGLPVPEAQYFGIPVVVTRDNELDAIHQGVVAADPDPASLARAIEAAIGSSRRPASGVRTWVDAAGEYRSALADLGVGALR